VIFRGALSRWEKLLDLINFNPKEILSGVAGDLVIGGIIFRGFRVSILN